MLCWLILKVGASVLLRISYRIFEFGIAWCQGLESMACVIVVALGWTPNFSIEAPRTPEHRRVKW